MLLACWFVVEGACFCFSSPLLSPDPLDFSKFFFLYTYCYSFSSFSLLQSSFSFSPSSCDLRTGFQHIIFEKAKDEKNLKKETAELHFDTITIINIFVVIADFIYFFSATHYSLCYCLSGTRAVVPCKLISKPPQQCCFTNTEPLAS